MAYSREIRDRARRLYVQLRTQPPVHGMADAVRRVSKEIGPHEDTVDGWRETGDWDAAVTDAGQNQAVADGDGISVDAEIVRLRLVIRQLNSLIRRADNLSPADASALKTLLAAKAEIKREVDPEGLLAWTERYLTWIRQNEPEGRADVIIESVRRFAERTFDVLDAAATLDVPDEQDAMPNGHAKGVGDG